MAIVLNGSTGITAPDIDVTAQSSDISTSGDATITGAFTSVGIDDNAAATAMTIDSSGNVLVAGTNTDPASGNVVGLSLKSNGQFNNTVNGGVVANLNRKTDDGDIVRFRKDGTTVGSIGNDGNNAYITLRIGYVGITGSATNGGSVIPSDGSGNLADNLKDLGRPTTRWDDIYATNGTIQTSDEREKQDIDVLSDAEHNVAVAAKGLIRKYRWKDAVAEKGDDARIHFGVIAQDLKAAFEAEGLDAGRYAMFIHSEWWEAEETYTDDDGVEQTRTNTYDSADEAPEGAVKKDRMGVRYPELLAFIIGAM